MTSIDEYQEKIITTLKTGSDKNIILQDQINSKPNYPYITYKFITKYQNEPGREILNNQLVDVEGTEYYQYNYKRYYTTILSLTAYSNDEIEANNTIEELYNFISFLGLEKFRSDNIVMKEVGNIMERDTLLIDDYERRFGFDTTFRLIKELNKNIETINTVEI